MRQDLVKLRQDREKITMEKGLMARDNNDLRENFAYDYWVEKENQVTIRIHRIIAEIEDLLKKK